MSWGDDPYAAISGEIKATDTLSIEPRPIRLAGLHVSPLCRHCHDPYLEMDEDPEYPRLCIGCAEHFRGLDQDDELIIAHDA